MKKQMAFLLSFTLAIPTLGSDNPFEKFFGSYEVVSATCAYNGQPTTENCDQKEIRVELREGTKTIQIAEFSPPGFTVGHPIYEVEDIQGGNQTIAKVNSPAPESAAWTYTIRLEDGRSTFEKRLFMRDGANYTYSFQHREKPLFGAEWTVQRKYVLKLK